MGISKPAFKRSRKIMLLLLSVLIVAIALVLDAGIGRQRKAAPQGRVMDSHWTLPVFDEKGSSQQIVPVSLIEEGAIVSYRSLDNNIAVVDMDGNITAVAPGETDIIVTTDLDGEIVHHTVDVMCEW